MEADYGDNPISKPEQDMFGIDGFVQSLARSVRTMRSPNGVVIALNGPWGSGKSSAINLLKHHLSDAMTNGEIEVVDFNPWWFRGEEALVLAFFRELYAVTKPSLGNKAKKILPKLGARLLSAGGAVAPIADAAGAAGAGGIASGVMGWLSGMIEDGESVDKLHTELGDALAKQGRRFVVMIDDIDRLAPDEALTMFRMVKSVGRLPNVIYVLSFDREFAERVVAERFPSEGPHYLEKIVQVAFELPTPIDTDVHRILVGNIEAIVGGIGDKRPVHVMNMFHAAVAPEIRTPRDATRYTNALSITWPAIQGEVDLGDFIAIEALRLFQPAIYGRFEITSRWSAKSPAITSSGTRAPTVSTRSCWRRSRTESRIGTPWSASSRDSTPSGAIRCMAARIGPTRTEGSRQAVISRPTSACRSIRTRFPYPSSPR